MDTTRWKTDDEFALLDLVARFQFKTGSSVSFQLGTKGDTIQTRGMKEPWVFGGGRVFTISGWLDVHHPCDGRHRLLLRVGLPDRYACWESMRELVAQVKTAFGLPADESYHVYIAGLSQQICMEEPVWEFQSATRWRARGHE